MFCSGAELEGFYRLINNDNFGVSNIVEAISADSFSKVPISLEELIVIHDTTKVAPKISSQEFGPITSGENRGFFAHVSLVTDLSPNPMVYGIGDVFFWTRSEGKVETNNVESHRWFDQVQSIESRPSQKKMIHVMDREGDSYEIFSKLVGDGRRFVVRLAHDRLVEGSRFTHLFESINVAEVVAERVVKLSRRKASKLPKKDRIHAPRESRLTKLKMSAQTIQFKVSGWLKRKGKDKGLPEYLALNVVRVIESDPPTGEKPVEWLLVTTEPVDSSENVLKVVDIYRRRWLIEEFFKAMKTGCQLEQRLVSALAPWYRMFCLFMPVAATIMNLRNLEELSLNDCQLLTSPQIQILTKLANKRGQTLNTIRDIKFEIAKLGGHIKYSGPPGWLTLARGYEELLKMEVGWNLHRDM